MVKERHKAWNLFKCTVFKPELMVFLNMKHHPMTILAARRTPCNLRYIIGKLKINALKLNIRHSVYFHICSMPKNKDSTDDLADCHQEFLPLEK